MNRNGDKRNKGNRDKRDMKNLDNEETQRICFNFQLNLFECQDQSQLYFIFKCPGPGIWAHFL